MCVLRKPEQLLQEGSKVFRRAPVNTVSIEGWVSIAGGKAADAQRRANSASTRVGAAYDSVFNLSLAVLCRNGWRCTAAEGHHVQALEAACAYAGIGAPVFDEVDAMRDMRNNQYQGIEPSPQDVEYALDVMGRVVPRLLQYLES
jgi:hypothetical protein